MQNLEEFRAFIEHYKQSPEYHEILGRQDLNDTVMNPTNLENLDNKPLPMSLGLSITQLWEDPGVQQIYGLSHQFQLNETAKYETVNIGSCRPILCTLGNNLFLKPNLLFYLLVFFEKARSFNL